MNNALKLAVLAVSSLFFAAVSFAQVSVRISSPGNGATVSSSFTLNASASGSYPITGWYVYVDNSAAWHTPGPTGSISAPLSLGTGSHQLHVRAWQSNGAYGDAFATVTVGSNTTSGVNVSLQAPTTGASTGSTFTVTASGSSPNGISGWAIYADNTTYWVGNTYSNSLSHSVTLGSGTHTLYVRAWDKGGAGYGTSGTAKFSVGSTSTSSTGLPTVPSTAKVWTKLEDTTDSWSDCSANCAGGQSTTNYWMAPFQTSPSRDGSSRQFFNGGAAWANVLWIKKLGNQNQAHHFLWDFWVYFDSTTAANVWAAEYDLWQSVGGHEFMMGSQCDFGTGYWDTWNSSAGHWVQTSIPCKRFAGGTWHHIQWYMERVSSNQYRYNTLVVDGVSHAVNQTFYTNGVNWADSMGVQWQLDLSSNGYDAHEWVDQVKLSIW